MLAVCFYAHLSFFVIVNYNLNNKSFTFQAMIIIIVIFGLIDLGIIFAIVQPFMHDNPIESTVEYFIYFIVLVAFGKFYGVYTLF